MKNLPQFNHEMDQERQSAEDAGEVSISITEDYAVQLVTYQIQINN